MSGMAQESGASRAVDFGATSLFASAAGYSCWLVSGLPAASATGFAAAFLGARFALKRVEGRHSFMLPSFAVTPIEPAGRDELAELLLTELAELLLTDAVGTERADADELLLEDRLDAPTEEARVIRLFDPRLLPTAGEMHERIASHLRGHESRNADATAELHQALTALRNSLR